MHQRWLWLLLGLLFLQACGVEEATLAPEPATEPVAPQRTEEPPTPTPGIQAVVLGAAGFERLYVLASALEPEARQSHIVAYDLLQGSEIFRHTITVAHDQSWMVANQSGTALYVATSSRQLYAYDGRDGRELWRQRLERLPFRDQSPPSDAEYFVPLAVDEALATLSLLHIRPSATDPAAVDAMQIVIVDTHGSRAAPTHKASIGACDRYAFGDSLLVCLHADPASGATTAQLVRWSTGETLQTHMLPASVSSVAMRPGSQHVWAALDSGEVFVFDETATAPQKLDLPPEPVGVTNAPPLLTFTPDGATLYLAHHTADGALVRALRSDTMALISSFSYSTGTLDQALLAADQSLWVGLSADTATIHRVRADSTALPALALPALRPNAMLLAPEPPPIPPTPTPTSPPTNTPVPRSGNFPPLPAWGDVPAVLLAWLNEAPRDQADVSALIAEWDLLYVEALVKADLWYSSQPFHSSNAFEFSDLDGDGSDEIIMLMSGLPRFAKPTSSLLHHLMVFSSRDGSYTLATVSNSADPEIEVLDAYAKLKLWAIQDLTNDGRAEIITNAVRCGASTCFDAPAIWIWDGVELRNSLILPDYSESNPDILEPDFAQTFADFRLLDADQDGIYAFEMTAGGSGSSGGCCTRRTISTFAWDGAEFRLASVEYMPIEDEGRQEPFWFIIDAARLFRDGAYSEAYTIYTHIIANPVPNLNIDIPYQNVARIARFQLMVTSVLLGRDDEALRWRDELRATDEAWAMTFWEHYAASGDVRSACEAARPYAAEAGHYYMQFRTPEVVTCVFR